jgi:hypothetical protein
VVECSEVVINMYLSLSAVVSESGVVLIRFLNLGSLELKLGESRGSVP